MARRGGEGESIQRDNSKKICFVICPIGKDNSPERLWSDKILKHIIEPAASEGYHIIRADKESSPGMITSRIIQLLKEADVVIADLSFYNPNVFYELAIRHVTKKPYIQLIKIDQEIPFDTATNRTIPIDTDVEIASNAKELLEKQLKSIESGKNLSIDNPIALTDLILTAESSGKTDQITNAKIIESLADIQSQLYRINQRVEDQSRNEPSRKNIGLVYPTKDSLFQEKNKSLKKIENEIITMENRLYDLEKKGKNESEIKNMKSAIDQLKNKYMTMKIQFELEKIFNAS